MANPADIALGKVAAGARLGADDAYALTHLGADRISGTRDTVELCPRALDVDALTEPGPSGLRGELLEGIQLHDAPEFEEWLAIERHRIALRDANAVLRLASRLVESGEVEQAAVLAGEVTRRHPLSCDAATTAMRAAALAGRRDDALDIHRSLHRALMDAGETVPREVDALAQRIRDAGPAPCVSARPVLLVGRERERIMLTRAVNDATHGRATLLLVTGDAGSGRTSLLALASAAAALGGAVVRARALPHDVSTPWSLLRALLRNGLANLPGVPAVQPDVLALLAWFSPALASRIHGVVDAVRDGETGWLHEAGDVAGIAAVMRRYLAQPEERARIGRQARARALREFSAERIQAEQQEYYAAALASLAGGR